MIDLVAELRAAGLSPEAIEAAAERAAERAVRRVLQEREMEVFLSAKEAATLAGRTPAAWKQLRRRRPEIDAISVGEGKDRRWKRSELVALLSRNRREK